MQRQSPLGQYGIKLSLYLYLMTIQGLIKKENYILLFVMLQQQL